MRKLNEQWVENGRMYKAVEGIPNFCIGCCCSDAYHCCGVEDCPTNHIKTGLIVKDLGPVNEDGFLREERSGQYPDISHDKRNGVYEAYLHATLINPAMSAVLVRVQASSMDRLKDAWNRRV